jgi:hypothetical protein
VAETNGLLNRRTLQRVPRVRIPPPPPKNPKFVLGVFFEKENRSGFSNRFDRGVAQSG